MNRLLVAIAFALLVQTAHAQLAAEGLVIGLQRNQVLAHIDGLSHGSAHIVCHTDSDDRLKYVCTSTAVTGLIVEGHAVEELYMEFLAKRLALLQVIFADRDPQSGMASLRAQMTIKLGEPACLKEEQGCEWKRDGQGLLVGVMDPKSLRPDEDDSGDLNGADSEKLTLVLAELEFDGDLWRYENQEFDDLYPIPKRGSPSLTEELSLR